MRPRHAIRAVTSRICPSTYDLGVAKDGRDPWVLGIERLRGFLIAAALIAGGIVVMVRGSGWGFVLIVAGVLMGVWTSRWPTRRESTR